MPPIHNDVLVSRPSIWERTPPQPRLSPDNQLLRLQQLFYPQNKCRHTHTIKAAPITLRYEPSPNTLRPLFTSRISTTFFGLLAVDVLCFFYTSVSPFPKMQLSAKWWTRPQASRSFCPDAYQMRAKSSVRFAGQKVVPSCTRARADIYNAGGCCALPTGARHAATALTVMDSEMRLSRPREWVKTGSLTPKPTKQNRTNRWAQANGDLLCRQRASSIYFEARGTWDA